MNVALKTPQVSPAAGPLPGSCTDAPRASCWPQEVRAATPVPGVWQHQDLGADACGVDLGGSLEGVTWLGRAHALSNREWRAERGPGRWGEGSAARPVHSGVPSVPLLAACPPAHGRALCPALALDTSSHRRLPPLSGAGEGLGCLVTPPSAPTHVCRGGRGPSWQSGGEPTDSDRNSPRSQKGGAHPPIRELSAPSSCQQVPGPPAAGVHPPPQSHTPVMPAGSHWGSLLPRGQPRNAPGRGFPRAGSSS